MFRAEPFASWSYYGYDVGTEKDTRLITITKQKQIGREDFNPITINWPAMGLKQ